MKKILSKLGGFFGRLFGVLLALLLGICLIFLIPLDYIKYKHSLYYKTEHKRYRLFAGAGIYFELYNEIIKNNLPIKYIFNPNNDALECGWFVYGNTLIIPNVFSFEYDVESGKWNYCCYPEEEDDEKRIIMPLDEYMETEIQEANELAGDTICNNAVVLIDASYIENAELAEQENNFLVYDDNRAEVLKSLCENVMQ